jgi:hypothetical protein
MQALRQKLFGNLFATIEKQRYMFYVGCNLQSPFFFFKNLVTFITVALYYVIKYLAISGRSPF